MSISAVGSGLAPQTLFAGASSDLASASQSLSSPSSGSGSDLSVGEQYQNGSYSEQLASAEYGFDGKVLASQSSVVSQLFSALA